VRLSCEERRTAVGADPKEEARPQRLRKARICWLMRRNPVPAGVTADHQGPGDQRIDDSGARQLVEEGVRAVLAASQRATPRCAIFTAKGTKLIALACSRRPWTRSLGPCGLLETRSWGLHLSIAPATQIGATQKTFSTPRRPAGSSAQANSAFLAAMETAWPSTRARDPDYPLVLSGRYLQSNPRGDALPIPMTPWLPGPLRITSNSSTAPANLS